MRIPDPPEPSILTAFFCAPLVTPILAIFLVALLPGIYTSEIDILIALPVVAVVSLIYGYVGMIFICLPIMLLLQLFKKFNSITLCLFTTVIGGCAWALMFHELPGVEQRHAYLVSLIIGAGCSLGVTAFFCLLGGITMRSTRPPGVAAETQPPRAAR